jgi:Domain of unknown function (DUF222)/HNH endonuclease
VAASARRLACDAGILPIVMNGQSVPLDVGREKRCISREQRTALIARDKGCAHPGCDRPPRLCDGHHVREWSQGGNTNLANLVLLCRRHHTLIHHSQWTIRMNSNGRPEFLPPPWLDRHRTPLRNVLHG